MPQEELEKNHRAMIVLYLDCLLWFVLCPVTIILPYLFLHLILPWSDFPHWLFSEVPAGLLVTLRRLRYNVHRLDKYMPAEHGGIQDYRRWWLGGPKRQAFFTIAAIFATTELVQFWLWFVASGFFCPTICPGAYMGDGMTAPLYPFDKDPEDYNQNAWYSPTYNGTIPSNQDNADWPSFEPDAPVPWTSVTPGLWPTNPYTLQSTPTFPRPLASPTPWRQGIPDFTAVPYPWADGETRPVATSFSKLPMPTTTWSGGLDPEMFTGIEIIGPEIVVEESGSTTSPPSYPPTRIQPEEHTL